MGKLVVALELIPTSKKPIRQQYFLRQYREAESSFYQATTHSAKIILIKSSSLLTFRVGWTRYVYWAHGESQGVAWIKVLSPIKAQGRATLGPTPVQLLWQSSYKNSLGVILKIMISCYKPMKCMIIICVTTSTLMVNIQIHKLNI